MKDPDSDGLAGLRKNISKQNPGFEALFQYPKAPKQYSESDAVRYDKRPLSINKLATMMKEIFVKTELSRTHKNHCVRATAIPFWSDAKIPNQHIQQISGHKRAETPIIMTTACPLSS